MFSVGIVDKSKSLKGITAEEVAPSIQFQLTELASTLA